MLGRSQRQRATCSLWGWAHAAGVNRANLTRLLFWEQALMRHYIRPAAVKVGITKRIGWHTFRHSYSTLLKASGADINSDARTASTRVHACDTRHVHAGRNPGKASGSSRGSQTIFSECKGSLGNRRQNRRYEFLRKVVPFCAYEFLSKPLEVVGSKVASPTGCEPVLPP
jgi:hypothetical protein